MPKYAVLLRAVNVAGHNLIAMQALRAALEEQGFADVMTHLQSGNAVVSSPAKPAAVAREVRDVIGAAFGFDVDVMVRSHRQLKSLVDNSPHGAAPRDPAKVLVAFLDTRPIAAKVRAFDSSAYGEVQMDPTRQEIYLYYPNGYGRAKLTTNVLEKKLDVRATARNWNTVTRLAEMTTPGR